MTFVITTIPTANNTPPATAPIQIPTIAPMLRDDWGLVVPLAHSGVTSTETDRLLGPYVATGVPNA
jgi:hypothetical protein